MEQDVEFDDKVDIQKIIENEIRDELDVKSFSISTALRTQFLQVNNTI